MDAKSIGELLLRLEARIARIERHLQLDPLADDETEENSQGVTRLQSPETELAAESTRPDLEQRIGEFWLARVGIIALVLGLAFLIIYPIAAFPPALRSAIGYLAVAALFALSYYWKKAYLHLSRNVFNGGMVLLYFTTVRLYFFTAEPVISSKEVVLALLLIIIGVHLYLAAKWEREFAAILAILLSFATCVISDTGYFTFVLIALTAAAATYLVKKHNWQAIGNMTIVLAYTTHLHWLLNNPLMGHTIGAVAEHQNNLVFLFVYALIFAMGNLFHYEDPSTFTARISRTLLNGFGFAILVNLVALTYFEKHIARVDLIASILFLGIAIFYWVHRHSKYSTSVYACFGYMTLSITIISHFGTPMQYIYLGIQSLLVLCTALWFRSKLIVVVNVFIYLAILLAYLVLTKATGFVSLSFAIVALVSARVLNWKKEYLRLGTEYLRNIYLISAFVVVPYGLFHAVPKHLVSVFWLGAAVFYFVMSLILHNRKYRWMAIATIFLTVIYVFLVDFARLDPFYRIISFLALSVVLLIVSLLYARYRTKAASKQDAPAAQP